VNAAERVSQLIRENNTRSLAHLVVMLERQIATLEAERATTHDALAVVLPVLQDAMEHAPRTERKHVAALQRLIGLGTDRCLGGP
jgi:hypothetical protein